ncbi:diaminopimelate epimerase [Prevotella sp. E2-28]|uniref:diaminopimelate epimerase n=1 Tax=Prevotella sp. E2-28 TaxID=2913620 RepID=UPI001EDC12CE|nr:diaminopimelate epimerase [Prevotella sp. E2-28]UKK53174.1 diaminopimelate epimerase [Prevotella sp. E2-28]
MSKIPFTKMHGCGNDYIYVNVSQHPIDDPIQAAIRWSDRHKGIGSDGLVLIDKSPIPEADFSMRIFNADGSEAMMCGNASRCIGKYLYERGLTDKTEIRLLTLSGVKTLLLHVENNVVKRVTVDMGGPILEDESQFIASRGLSQGTFVSMGNPHYVIFTDNVDQVGEAGRALEFHPAFPQRCNIEFAHIEADGTIRTRVWERGSGITQACGTGACATAIAAFLTGRAGRKSNIAMDGGTLSIEWCESDRSVEGRFFQKNHVYKTGPAEFVFDGEIDSI